MTKTFLTLSDFELRQLTQPLQFGEYSKDLALEIITATTLSMVSEPGDRMMGFLSRTLGSLDLMIELVEGFNVQKILWRITESDSLEECNRNFGDPLAALQDSKERWLPRLKSQNLVQILTNTSAMGLSLIIPSSEIWPKGLDDLGDHAPLALFVQGSPSVLESCLSGVSIVGSRAASSYGKVVTDLMVSQLAEGNRAVVSGGAIGIDGFAHRAALDHSLATIAVMAGGLDRLYPRSNFELFTEITKSGALISELPLGSAPTRWRFLQRNRLIAALTPTTVVVEAGLRSGSIRTANDALELDRELLAVPGSILSETSAGCNALISEGKANIFTGFLVPKFEKYSEPSELAKRAADALRDLKLANTQEIATDAGLTSGEVAQALAELRSRDLVNSIPLAGANGRYALKYVERTGIS
ncbi:MAG: DNA-processing protein DprA [Actinomycetota bacterium]